MLQKFIVNTSQKREIYNLTKIVNDLLLRNSCYDGMCFLFCLHTTCAITTVDLDDEGTKEDYINSFEAVTPKIEFKHTHDPAHFGEHFMASNVGPSLCIPVQSASMVLGLNQQIALIEFSGPRERHIVLSFYASPAHQAF